MTALINTFNLNQKYCWQPLYSYSTFCSAAELHQMKTIYKMRVRLMDISVIIVGIYMFALWCVCVLSFHRYLCNVSTSMR